MLASWRYRVYSYKCCGNAVPATLSCDNVVYLTHWQSDALYAMERLHHFAAHNASECR